MIKLHPFSLQAYQDERYNILDKVEGTVFAPYLDTANKSASFTVTLDGSFDNVLQYVNFSDGIQIDHADLLRSIHGTYPGQTTSVNTAPVVAHAILDKTTTEDAPLSYAIPANTFTDANSDSLTLTAKLTSGAALPTWLSFNAATNTFAGTPTNSAVGALAIRVTANDGHGGSVYDDFNLNVTNVNDTPTVTAPLIDQTAKEGAPFSYVFASNSFTDVDVGDTLTYTAKVTGGATLPTWLTFNTATHTFSGTPLTTSTNLTLTVTASDRHGGTVSDDFNLTVQHGMVTGSTITGTNASEALTGGTGNDTISGGNGADTINGSAGADVLTGGTGPDVFKFTALTHSTTAAPDHITDFHEAEGDVIDLSGLGYTTLTTAATTAAGQLHLTYVAATDRTTVSSNQSTFQFYLDGNHTTTLTNDSFYFSNPLTLNGVAGNNDTLTGTASRTLIQGLDGNDKLIGGVGADTLDGGAGIDTLTGGGGHDVFKFSNLTDSTETALDRITDFTEANDHIDLRGLGFTTLTTHSTTIAGELRLAYSAASDRTYVRSDQSTFEFYLDGNHTTTLHNEHFIFG